MQAATPPKHFWDIWALFDFPSMFAGSDGGGVLWGAMPRQLPTVAALAFVVAFGSSLDVAAIQQDNSEELDYNKELVTVVSTFSGSWVPNDPGLSVDAGKTRLNDYLPSPNIVGLSGRFSRLQECLLTVMEAPKTYVDSTDTCSGWMLSYF